MMLHRHLLPIQVSTILDPLSGDLLYKRILLSDPTRMDRDRDKMAERILHLTLEIIFRLTGEDYTVVKKTSRERCQIPVSDGWGRPLIPITGPPPHALIHEDINEQNLLELAYKIIKLLTGEVPIRCQDVTVHFSMEEWEYLEGHKDLYKDFVMEVPQPLTSPVLSSERTTPERCPCPLLLLNCKQEDPNVPQDQQVPTISDPLSRDLLYKQILLSDPTRMNRERDKMTETILHLILEILFRLTGEDYTVVKKTSSERCQAPVYEGWGRPLSPITGFPPHSLIHEDIINQKILELTYKMIEQLTGEVPVRCQDVTFYFSMEEWEYLEGHKDLYKDVMMEVPQPFTTPGLSSKRTTPERCPHPLHPQDCKQEDPNVPLDHQGKDLTHINTTGTYVRGDERCKEISTDNRTDNCTKSAEGRMIFSDFPAYNLDILSDTCEEHDIVSDTPEDLLRKNLSSDPDQRALFSASSKTNILNKSHRMDVEYEIADRRKKTFPCSECEKCFNTKSRLVAHQRTHTGEKPFLCSECGKCYYWKYSLDKHQRIHRGDNQFSCSECGKCFTTKSYLVAHHRLHTGEKPYSCSECGKRFNWKTRLVTHQRIHTGEKPFLCSECGNCYYSKYSLAKHQRTHRGDTKFSCSECGKCFTQKVNLIRHHKIHTRDKPFSCSECGKCFKDKTSLVIHQLSHTDNKTFPCYECGKLLKNKSALIRHLRNHIGDKPFSCSECGKCFNQKARLNRHQIIHTEEKPFSCSECRKCFNQKHVLIRHQKIHTGEKPFPCSQCGKCFNHKHVLIRHQKIHTGEKPFSCSECGKCFTQKSSLVKHQISHTDNKTFSCSECGKFFKRKSVLIRHFRIHTGQKPFSCSECGKSYDTKSRLVIHERAHTGEKPFSCSECWKCFTQKSSLVEHQISHSDNKTFSCSECGKIFKRKSVLIRHLRIHTGQKPFSCSECGKGYDTKSRLVIHQRAHTAEKPFSCSICGKCFNWKKNLATHQKMHTKK
ncbi:uncharacterized protein LOC143767217 isoform X1 [Ranitomeya variabilis]|uniref:uncharacterized protein LOC143767217 isoform X1 n=1 Tax=Ranitomeya variabilis TaxID=490064 RepID=UPI004057C2BB